MRPARMPLRRAAVLADATWPEAEATRPEPEDNPVAIVLIRFVNERANNNEQRAINAVSSAKAIIAPTAYCLIPCSTVS